LVGLQNSRGSYFIDTTLDKEITTTEVLQCNSFHEHLDSTLCTSAVVALCANKESAVALV